MEKYSSFYSWDRNHVIIFHAYSWHGHVTTFNCKVNQILQKNYSYEFRKKFKVCLDRYLTRISHILHILFMIKQNILYIQRPTIAQIIQETRKKGDFKSSGNFLGKWWDYNACKSYIYISMSLLTIFKPELNVSFKGSQYFMVKNATLCNFSTISHPLQCDKWSPSLRKFDLHRNLETTIWFLDTLNWSN